MVFTYNLDFDSNEACNATPLKIHDIFTVTPRRSVQVSE
jgi:hypothetical protein